MRRSRGASGEKHLHETNCVEPIKDAFTERYHYNNHDQPEAYLNLFLDVYNHVRRLKTLTLAQFI